jgi:transposase
MTARYIGIDAHANSCTIAVLGATGKRLRLWQVETEGGVLVEAIRSIAKPRYICIEEGSLSEWLFELLDPLAAELQVIQPLRSRGVKSDTTDAWAAADIARTQRKDVVTVFKAPSLFTGLKKAVRTYECIQRDFVRCKHRIRANYRGRGLAVDSSIYDSEGRTQWLAKVGRHHRLLLKHYYAELDALTPIYENAEAWLHEEAERLPVVNLLATAPGIGTIRASQIVATVLSPHRFRTSRQFWAYCGLAIVMRSSADWVPRDGKMQRTHTAQTRGLNRNHQPLLKCVFKGAATSIVHPNMTAHPLHQGYQRMLAANTKPHLAKLTVARRLAAAVLAMWKNKEKYDPAKQMNAS